LATLLEAGIVSRDAATLQYRIGPRVFALAARSIETTLVADARPFLRRLTQATQETSHLCVLREGNVLTLASELSPHEVRTTGWQGVTTAAWRTPSGRALLSDWDDESLRSWYEAHGRDKAIVSQLDPQMTASGFSVLAAPPRDKMVVRDFQSLLAEMVHIRETGYAILDEELETGVVGASAPVRDFTGAIIAAINVSAPKARMTNRLDELGAYVARAATTLSLRLGAPATADVRPAATP
jgi:DNA-binding IclR family transcriptional regulator